MQVAWSIYKVYTVFQWILFFLLYSLIGWIWESSYVSIKKHCFVNRGFMHGPMLPIYGAGALCILLSTLPVSEHVVLIFLVGMVSSTILEYITGAVMEKLFQVRYWDYTNQRCNLKGYICLSSSLAWGAFSVLLVKLIHPPISNLVRQIPEYLTQNLVLVLLTGGTVDFTLSFIEAIELRDMLERFAENNENLRRVRMRLDVVRAVMDDNAETFKMRLEERFRKEAEELLEKAGANKEKLAGRLEVLKGQHEDLLKRRTKTREERGFRRSLRILHRNPDITSVKREELKKALEEFWKGDNDK